LAKREELGYGDVLQTHKTLFEAVYPWAGQGRTQAAPLLTIKKGPVIFANPPEIRRAVEFGLHLGQNKETAYLNALTNELERPGKGILDNYLKPFIGSAVAYDKLAAKVANAPGLDDSAEAQANEVLGQSNESTVRAQYEAMLQKRSRA
jgi:cell filamentation protein